MLNTLRQAVISCCEVRVARFLNAFVPPRFINFITTYKCDSRCISCNIWSKYQKNCEGVKEELSLQKINDFFRINKKYFSKLIGVGFSGGEFTLRNDAVELIRFLKDSFPNIKLGFQTNGLQPEKVRAILKQVIAFDPQFNIAVSIDGPREIHDRVRGVEGAFDRAVLTVRYAKELGISRITTGMTINQINFSYIPETYQISKDIGTEFSCFLAEASDYFNNQGINYQINTTQKQTVIENLKKFKYDYFMDNLRRQLEGKRKRTLPCYSGYSSLVLDPYGNIMPCILINKPFGNIKAVDDLKAMIVKKSTKDVRESLKKCHCWCQCEVSSSAFVDPIDVARWFIFDCKDKKGFLKKISQRWIKG
jgi:Fe-coproporphyrin III synthase